MVNIQIIGLSEDEYIEAKKEMRLSKSGSWKNFFMRMFKEWKQLKQ